MLSRSAWEQRAPHVGQEARLGAAGERARAFWQVGGEHPSVPSSPGLARPPRVWEPA